MGTTRVGYAFGRGLLAGLVAGTGFLIVAGAGAGLLGRGVLAPFARYAALPLPTTPRGSP